MRSPSRSRLAPAVGASASRYQLKLTLRDTEPTIWRRIEVPGTTFLGQLHNVIQKVMGWRNAHLHEFVAQGVRYGVPDPDEPHYKVEPDWRVQLRTIAPAAGLSFEYVYDLGDNWIHDVLVEQIDTPAKPLRYPICLGGERSCPPEDCGGVGGYERMLDVLADPDDPEHDDMRRWVGRRFDPQAFDLAAVNRKLRLLK
ncbi:MAG TPA: plasmid pRiA4b ORF-3 family protein [Methylomirabilota bacterium]|nr:plasmid pRiA4b ORF-3 family protein [Methylomirabilota bacterium]